MYRFVKSDPPQATDMLSWLELGQGQNRPACRRAALSCYRDRSHLEEIRDAVPRRKKDLIARLILRPGYGKLVEDGNDTHCSLWLRARHLAFAAELFQVVA